MQQRTDRFPDFFVVGAPRCGTTAISKYLSRNPHICFSRPKEPHFFSITLHETPDADLHSDYLELFFPHCSGDYQATGEGSVSYLYYPEAIRRIQQLNPQARFIVMARNPVDMIHSYHARLLAILDEDVEDFATAWGLQEARARGEQLHGYARQLPADTGFHQGGLRRADGIPPAGSLKILSLPLAAPAAEASTHKGGEIHAQHRTACPPQGQEKIAVEAPAKMAAQKEHRGQKTATAGPGHAQTAA